MYLEHLGYSDNPEGVVLACVKEGGNQTTNNSFQQLVNNLLNYMVNSTVSENLKYHPLGCVGYFFVNNSCLPRCEETY